MATGLSGLYGTEKQNRDVSRGGGGSLPIFGARVRDIILDNNHNYFVAAGEWNAIGAIMFESAKSPILSPPGQSTSAAPVIFAYPLFPNIKQYPLLNEIVVVMFLPDSNIQQNSTSGKYYYLPPINIWSSQIQNAIPGLDDLPVTQNKSIDLIRAGSPNIVNNNTNNLISLGKNFTEGSYNPLLPYEGDVIYEGRFGNSIRFSSTTQGAINNQWSTTGGNGNPIFIIRNGQAPTSVDSWIPVVEDINNDLSSIYLTSTQQLPLNVSSLNDFSFSKSTPPIDPKQYAGNQIILNSGRLVFNAKSESILILANESIQLSCNETLGVDAKQISLTADTVYLGSSEGDEGTRLQSVVLGENLNFVLSDIATFLQTLSIAFKTATDSNGAPIVSLQSIAFEADTLSNDITNIVNNKNLLSKQVKIV